VRNRWLLNPFVLDAPEPALERLAQPDWFVNKATLTAHDQLARLCEVHRPLVAEVERVAAAGERPVTVAGDCCAAIGVLAGIQHAGFDPLLVWLDAHGDFNTHDTTLSGFVGGMPLAMITGRGNQALVEADGLTPLPDTRVVLADARDLDPPERDLLQRSGVTHITDLDRLVDRVANRPVYVHFDVDVLDPAEAPDVLFPVPGGPSVERLRLVLAHLRATVDVIGASMTTWAVARHSEGLTAIACWRVFDNLVGDV
jgi:arginase